MLEMMPYHTAGGKNTFRGNVFRKVFFVADQIFRFLYLSPLCKLTPAAARKKKTAQSRMRISLNSAAWT